MTPTTEKSIEVAEKIWGWKWYPYLYKRGIQVREHWEDGVEAIYPDADGLTKERFIEQETNSWAGFGKTVEAVAKKKCWINLKDNEKLKPLGGEHYDIGFYRTGGDFFPLHGFDPFNPTSLIEATHLAALETFK